MEQSAIALLHERIQETVARLSLYPRVRELVRKRGWRLDDDLIACLVMAVVCVAEGSSATKLKRPSAIGDDWPHENAIMKAGRLVHLLSLTELLEA